MPGTETRNQGLGAEAPHKRYQELLTRFDLAKALVLWPIYTKPKQKPAKQNWTQADSGDAPSRLATN